MKRILQCFRTLWFDVQCFCNSTPPPLSDSILPAALHLLGPPFTILFVCCVCVLIFRVRVCICFLLYAPFIQNLVHFFFSFYNQCHKSTFKHFSLISLIRLTDFSAFLKANRINMNSNITY